MPFRLSQLAIVWCSIASQISPFCYFNHAILVSPLLFPVVCLVCLGVWPACFKVFWCIKGVVVQPLGVIHGFVFLF